MSSRTRPGRNERGGLAASEHDQEQHGQSCDGSCDAGQGNPTAAVSAAPKSAKNGVATLVRHHLHHLDRVVDALQPLHPALEVADPVDLACQVDELLGGEHLARAGPSTAAPPCSARRRGSPSPTATASPASRPTPTPRGKPASATAAWMAMRRLKRLACDSNTLTRASSPCAGSGGRRCWMTAPSTVLRRTAAPARRRPRHRAAGVVRVAADIGEQERPNAARGRGASDPAAASPAARAPATSSAQVG